MEAIALGGSRAGAEYDEKSDYDLYIYCTSIPDEGVRKRILEKCCQYMEIGNSFWELEDDCTLKDGVDIDILYRNMEDLSQMIHSVVEEHMAYNGYTTCMWHNLLHSRILYDKNGKLECLQNKGEKRMVQYAKEQAEILPANFVENVNKLLENLFVHSDIALKTLQEMIAELRAIL